MHPTLSRPEQRLSQLRLIPVLHLQTGEATTIIAETMKRFEERVSFGPAAHRSMPQSPAMIVAEQLINIAQTAHKTTDVRPIIVTMPMAALIHQDTPLACDAAIRRTSLCHQEICFDISDASLARGSKDARQGLNRLKELGFRLSLDATRSWQAPLSTDLRILLDAMRIDRRHIEIEDDIETRIDAAASSGLQVIADHASWRDGDWLSSLGVDFAIRPKTDG